MKAAPWGVDLPWFGDYQGTPLVDQVEAEARPDDDGCSHILLLGGLGIWAIDLSTTMFETAADKQVHDSVAIVKLRDHLITSEWWAMQYANQGQKGDRGRAHIATR
jgi:hypothetical protein